MYRKESKWDFSGCHYPWDCFRKMAKRANPLWYNLHFDLSQKAEKRLLWHNLTEHFSRSEDVITSGRNALTVDAGVERVGAARGPVSHGGPQQVVGRRLLHAAEQLALVWTSDYRKENRYVHAWKHLSRVTPLAYCSPWQRKTATKSFGLNGANSSIQEL